MPPSSAALPGPGASESGVARSVTKPRTMTQERRTGAAMTRGVRRHENEGLAFAVVKLESRVPILYGVQLQTFGAR